MTWSLKLAGLPRLPRADAKWSPMITNRSTKSEGLSKTWVLRGKQFEDFWRKREQKQNSRPFKSTPWNTRSLNTTNYSDKFCASFIILFVTHRRLLTNANFWKKGFSSNGKYSRPIFSHILKNGKPRETSYKSPIGFVTIIVYVIRSFPLDLRSRWKIDCSKKGSFPPGKKIQPRFSQTTQ